MTLDGLTITGSQHSAYNSREIGIYVGSAVASLTVRNCYVSNFGESGMWLGHVTGLQVDHNTVRDVVYAGIMVLSGKGGGVTNNLVERVGVVGSEANSGNAYGISLSQQNPAVDPPTTDFKVTGNTVNDVPTWTAIDTHSGQRNVFQGNTVTGSYRGIFVTGYATARALDNDVSGNTVHGFSGSYWALTSVYSTGGDIRNNVIVSWPKGREILTTSGSDAAATAVDIMISGNTIIP